MARVRWARFCWMAGCFRAMKVRFELVQAMFCAAAAARPCVRRQARSMRSGTVRHSDIVQEHAWTSSLCSSPALGVTSMDGGADSGGAVRR